MILVLGMCFSYRSYQRRDLLNRHYASDEARQYAIERAEQVQSSLESDFPSFVKPMLQSHVTGGFWLVITLTIYKTKEVRNQGHSFLLSRPIGYTENWRAI